MVQARNRMFGVGFVAIALGVGLFLLVAPSVERDAHLSIVASGENVRVGDSLRHLCWIRSGVEGLDELVPGLALERRRLVLREAVALGCLDQLAPSIRASYYIIDTDGARHLEKAVGYETDAIEPALEAMESSDGTLARRGALVAAALARRMNGEQQSRAIQLSESLGDGTEAATLRQALGIVPLAKPNEGNQALETFVEEQLETGDELPGGDGDETKSSLEPIVPPLRPPQLTAPSLKVLFARDANNGAPSEGPSVDEPPDAPSDQGAPEQPDAGGPDG